MYSTLECGILLHISHDAQWWRDCSREIAAAAAIAVIRNGPQITVGAAMVVTGTPIVCMVSGEAAMGGSP